MTHDKHAAAARAGGLNAGVVAAKVPTYKHVARGPTEADRVLALVASGSIDPTTMWRKTGTVAISGWQALSAHDGIAAKEKKELAVKAWPRRRRTSPSSPEANAAGRSGRACVARAVSVEREGMGQRGCARRLGE